MITMDDDYLTLIEYNGNTGRWEIFNTFDDTKFDTDFETEEAAIDYLKLAFFYSGSGVA